jgi:hypothetical protein
VGVGSGDEAFKLFDHVVGDPAGADAQGFAEALADDVTDAGFGFGDPVGSGAAVVGLVSQDHAHVGFCGDP